MDEAESRLEKSSGKDKAVPSDRSVTDAYLKEKEHPYAETAAPVYWPLVQIAVRAATVATDINATGAVSLGIPVSQVAATPQAAGRFDGMAVADDTLNNDIVMDIVMEGSEAVSRHEVRVPPREGRQCPLIWEDREIRPAKEAGTAEVIADPTTATEGDARSVEAKAVVAVLDTAATEAGAGVEARANHAADLVLVALETPAEASDQTPLQKACADDVLRLPLHLRVRVARVEAKAKEKEQEKDHIANTVSTLPLENVVMVTNAVLATISIPRRSETRSSRRSTNAESNANPMRAQRLWQGCWW